MFNHLFTADPSVDSHFAFSSILDEAQDAASGSLAGTIARCDLASSSQLIADTQPASSAQASNVSRSSKGSKGVSYPKLRKIEKLIEYNCRRQVVAILNEKLYEGELSSMLEAPVVAPEIKSESCVFTNCTVWHRNQTDFIVDADFLLTNILVEGESEDTLTDFKIYASIFFTSCDGIEYEIQEVDHLSRKPVRDLVKMDRHVIPIFTFDFIDANIDEVWNDRIPGSMEDANKRKPNLLADAYNLDICRLPLYNRPNDEFVLFFQEGDIMIQDPPPAGSKELPPPRTVPVSADTIVLNTNVNPYDDYALAIYKACFMYEWYYPFFMFNGLTDSRLDLIERTQFVPDKVSKPKDPLSFIPAAVHRGGFALMMPRSIIQKKVWREYQRVSAAPGPIGYINHAGWRYEEVIRIVSSSFCLKNFRVRQRLVQLGCIAARGALNYDPDLGRYFIPFAFSMDEDALDWTRRKVKYSEAVPTYSITRGALYYLYKKNPALQKLLSLGVFTFLDGLVCINSDEYVQWNNEYYRMTPSANADVSACCLRFHTEYMNRRNHYKFDAADYKKYACLFDKNSSASIERAEEEHTRILAELPESFPDALKYLMKHYHPKALTPKSLAARTGLSEVVITRYCTDPHAEYLLEEVILICLGLNLPPCISGALLEKANLSVVRTGPFAYYGFILDCLYLESVGAVQAFVKRLGYHQLADPHYYEEDNPADQEEKWRDAM